MRHYNLFTAFLLSLLAISSSFLPPAILAVVGLLDSFVDSFTLVVTPGPSRQKIQVPKRRLLSSKSSRTRKTDEFIDDENSNASTTKSETESTASNTTRNKKEATTTKDYQRIEEWNKKTHDSNHVIGQLKHENAKWRKTFGNLEKLEKQKYFRFLYLSRDIPTKVGLEYYFVTTIYFLSLLCMTIIRTSSYSSTTSSSSTTTTRERMLLLVLLGTTSTLLNTLKKNFSSVDFEAFRQMTDIP